MRGEEPVAWVVASDVPAFEDYWRIYSERFDDIARAVAPRARSLMPPELQTEGPQAERLREDGRATLPLV